MLTTRSAAKKILPPRMRAALRSAAGRGSAAADRALELVGRKGLRVWRSVHARPRAAAQIAMLCVRKPAYVDMALASINSLHYRNPAYHVLLHLDPVCLEAFESRKRHIDYPEKLRTVSVPDESPAPWQFTKLDVVLRVSSQGTPFVDADSRWHADPAPLIPADRAMFLVVVNTIGAVEWERALVARDLRHPEWSGLLHFNTGFVSIPRSLYSEEFAERSRLLARQIYESPADGSFSDAQNWLRKHTCEEIALSITAQTCIRSGQIALLKTSDGPGNRRRLESYYYGALNNDER